jgi:hypothetical protein
LRRARLAGSAIGGPSRRRRAGIVEIYFLANEEARFIKWDGTLERRFPAR